MKAFCPNIYCVFVFLTPIMDTLQGESRVQKPWTKEVKMFKIKSNLTWVGEKWQSLFVFWVKKGPQKMFWKRKSSFECAISYILKDQIISKANCQAVNSSKKQTNEFVFTSIRRVFIHFLEESLPEKKRYEIIWPLKRFNFS